MSVNASSRPPPPPSSSHGPAGVPSASTTSSATIQRDINRLFSSHAASPSVGRTRTHPTPPYHSKPKEDLGSLPTHVLFDRIQSQRQLLASLDAGMLSLPDNGQRIRDAIVAIESILASRSSTSPASASATAGHEEDALVQRMQSVSLSSPVTTQKSSSRFRSHKVHMLSDDVATQVLTQARELEKKRTMQAALARLREGTAKFHANPPAWARPALGMSASPSGRKHIQRAVRSASSNATPMMAPSDAQPRPMMASVDNAASESDWDTDSDDDDQEDILDSLDLGYDAFSDADEDGHTALGRRSGSAMDVDSDDDEDDRDSGYQYHQ